MKFACQELEQLYTLVFTFEGSDVPKEERIRRLLHTALADFGLEPLVSESIPANSLLSLRFHND